MFARVGATGRRQLHFRSAGAVEQQQQQQQHQQHPKGQGSNSAAITSLSAVPPPPLVRCEGSTTTNRFTIRVSTSSVYRPPPPPETGAAFALAEEASSAAAAGDDEECLHRKRPREEEDQQADQQKYSEDLFSSAERKGAYLAENHNTLFVDGHSSSPRSSSIGDGVCGEPSVKNDSNDDDDDNGLLFEPSFFSMPSVSASIREGRSSAATLPPCCWGVLPPTLNGSIPMLTYAARKQQQQQQHPSIWRALSDLSAGALADLSAKFQARERRVVAAEDSRDAAWDEVHCLAVHALGLDLHISSSHQCLTQS